MPKSELVDQVLWRVHAVLGVVVSSSSLNHPERVLDGPLECERVGVDCLVAGEGTNLRCRFVSLCPSCSKTAVTMADMSVVVSVEVFSDVHCLGLFHLFCEGFLCVVRLWYLCRGRALHLLS